MDTFYLNICIWNVKMVLVYFPRNEIKVPGPIKLTEWLYIAFWQMNISKNGRCKMKKCSMKTCCKHCKQVKFKGTTKHAEQQDLTDIMNILLLLVF